MNNAELIDRATKAKAILDSPVYQQAFDNCRLAIIARIEATKLADTETAEQLRHCLKLLRDVRANLEVSMKQGKMAQFQIAQEEERRKNPLRGLFGTR